MSASSEHAVQLAQLRAAIEAAGMRYTGDDHEIAIALYLGLAMQIERYKTMAADRAARVPA
jgi:hypothetical protein